MKKVVVLFMMISVWLLNAKTMKTPGQQYSAPKIDQKIPVVIEKKEEIITPEVKITTSAINREEIIQKIDNQLSLPLSDVWYDTMDNLLFDLSAVDRAMARNYVQQVRQKIVDSIKPKEVIVEKIVEKPVIVEKIIEKPVFIPQKEMPSMQPTGDDQPMIVSKKIAPKKLGGEPIVPEGEGMKIGIKKAPPQLGGGPVKKPGEVVKPVSKPVVPKPVEQIFSVPKLKILDNEKLLALFAELLEKLPSNWNNQVVEKVEEKTKYGSKIYNVYGAPIPKWVNDMNTLKKVLVMNMIMPEEEITKKVADRIVQVRSEKSVKPVVSIVQEEKPQEELTEEDIIRLIKGLLAEPKTDQLGWVVSIKGNIKALDKLNHEAALEYHNRFIKLTGEKPFLKP